MSGRAGEADLDACARLMSTRIFRVTSNVFICVSSFNPRARALYERLGDTYVGALTDYFVRGHDELLFRKTRGPLREHTP